MFIEIPANKNSLNLRKLIHGVGINDADYIVRPRVDGKSKLCSYYERWHNMLTRCYSAVEHARSPTYIDCTVCEEWLTFTNFKIWMKSQEWKGKHLDKDAILPNNKIYSPEFSSFVSRDINNAIESRENKRLLNGLPQGVRYLSRSKTYECRIKINGKIIKLGKFSTTKLCELAFNNAKADRFISLANTETDDRVANGLRLHAKLLQG